MISHQWMAYRLVLEQLATYHEVSQTMSLDDVDLLCIAADAWNEAARPPPR